MISTYTVVVNELGNIEDEESDDLPEWDVLIPCRKNARFLITVNVEEIDD